MRAVFDKVHGELKEWLRQNALVLFTVLVAYAVAVAVNNVMHGGELVISIIAGIAVAAAAFAVAFFIAGPIALALLTLFTYAIERKVRTR